MSKKKFKPELDQVLKTGKAMSKHIMVMMLKGQASEDMVRAWCDWKDATEGKPDWGKTCKK